MFLKRRQQVVVIQGCKSSPVWCTSGVPQGSVLGPLLFLILIHDITKDIKQAMLSSFADDTKLWKGITVPLDEAQLQEDLDRIYIWAEQNNMEFNSKKFQAIRFAEMILSHSNYHDDIGAAIEESSLVKDLGIHMSSNAKFDQHIRKIVNRGKQMAGWILRIFKTRSPGVMLILLKQLVFAAVEYNSVLWNPSDITLINLLESVQSNFLRKIESPTLPADADYIDRLQHFKLYSFQRRRERYSIFYIWKVIHNIYPNPGLHLNTTSQDHMAYPNLGVQMDAHPRLGFSVQHANNPPDWIKELSPLKKCCDLYNCLPAALRQPSSEEVPSFEDFKKAVDLWLAKIPDQPSCGGRQRLGRTNSIVHQVVYIQR